jgi:hypothetical protein
MSALAEASDNAGMFYSIVRSLNNFNEIEIKPIINCLLSISERENCFVGTYYRILGNVDTILLLQNSKHFQAACMLARGLFELAVDMKLLEVDSKSWMKMKMFPDLEKLRSAKIAVNFRKAHPQTGVDVATHSAFVTNNEQRINATRRALWPNQSDILHWSGLRMRERVEQLASPFDEIYAIDYPRLGWYVHPGLTGVLNLRAETFTYLCSYAFKLAADAYWESILVMIREFRIEKATEKIREKMKLAKMLPFTKDPAQADGLARELLE